MCSQPTQNACNGHVAITCQIGGLEDLKAVKRRSNESTPIDGIIFSYAQCVREECGLINSRLRQ